MEATEWLKMWNPLLIQKQAYAQLDTGLVLFKSSRWILGIIVDLARQIFALSAMLMMLFGHAAMVNRTNRFVYILSPINLSLNCPASLAGLVKILTFIAFHSTWT